MSEENPTARIRRRIRFSDAPDPETAPPPIAPVGNPADDPRDCACGHACARHSLSVYFTRPEIRCVPGCACTELRPLEPLGSPAACPDCRHSWLLHGKPDGCDICVCSSMPPTRWLSVGTGGRSARDSEVGNLRRMFDLTEAIKDRFAAVSKAAEKSKPSMLKFADSMEALGLQMQKPLEMTDAEIAEFKTRWAENFGAQLRQVDWAKYADASALVGASLAEAVAELENNALENDLADPSSEPSARSGFLVWAGAIAIWIAVFGVFGLARHFFGPR